MGIDVSHSLVVGASHKELEPFFSKVIEQGETDTYEACEDDYDVVECYFEYASPYYDSDVEDWFIGFEVSNFTEPDIDWYKEVMEACTRFEELTGVKAKIRGGSHVW